MGDRTQDPIHFEFLTDNEFWLFWRIFLDLDGVGLIPEHFRRILDWRSQNYLFVCSLDVLKLLFHHAEDTGGYVLLSRMIMDQDRDEQTALHLAVENGHTDIVNLLIDKGICWTKILFWIVGIIRDVSCRYKYGSSA